MLRCILPQGLLWFLISYLMLFLHGTFVYNKQSRISILYYVLQYLALLELGKDIPLKISFVRNQVSRAILLFTLCRAASVGLYGVFRRALKITWKQALTEGSG
jgi:hypothetical protein